MFVRLEIFALFKLFIFSAAVRKVNFPLFISFQLSSDHQGHNFHWFILSGLLYHLDTLCLLKIKDYILTFSNGQTDKLAGEVSGLLQHEGNIIS